MKRKDLHDTRIDEKIVLSGLRTSMLFVFAYVDIFAFWRADVIEGALAGTVPGAGLRIDQTFLALTTVYIAIPSLMIVASLIMPAKINRTANLVVGLVYFASIVVTLVGETWVYYIVGSVVELVLLLGLLRVAWSWRGARSGLPAGR